MKRYVRELANDIIRYNPEYKDAVEDILRYSQMCLITDFEAVKSLMRVADDEDYQSEIFG